MNKHILLSLTLLCILGLGGCRHGKRLPSRVALNIVESSGNFTVGSGSYISSWSGSEVRNHFRKKLDKYLKKNNIRVENRNFINTGYVLEINDISVSQKSKKVEEKGPNCSFSTSITVESISIGVDLVLKKDGVILDEWHLGESCTEGTRTREDKDDPDACGEVCAKRMWFFSLKPMIRRCARVARTKISHKMYDTAF